MNKIIEKINQNLNKNNQNLNQNKLSKWKVYY